jgi:N-acetylmuramoyl-L-alanine amidase
MRFSLVWTLAVMAAACVRIPGGLPPVPRVAGPLTITVVYPPAGSAIDAGDSSFVFGSAGSGAAAVTLNGQPARVWPNGAWLAWIRLPDDSLMRFEVVARAGTDSASTVHEVRRAARFRSRGDLWIDTTSFEPAGRVWWPPDEALPLTVRASEGAELRLRLPDGRVIPLAPLSAAGDVAAAIRAFDRDSQNLARPAHRERYVGGLRGVPVGAPLGPVLGRGNDTRSGPDPMLEAIRGRDTVRVRWPLRVTLLDAVPVQAELNDDQDGTGRTDRLTVGRALRGGTYHWFFPTGTRAVVVGRVNGDARLRLSAGSVAWVAADEAVPLAAGSPGPAVVGSVTATPRQDRVQLRIPASYRVPYQVDDTPVGIRLRLYGAVGDPNWIRYGETTGLLERVSWRQSAADEVEFEIALSQPLWGYRLRWERADLILELRRRPEIDPKRPLRGRLIVVDPGHPPGGATGPTGLKESEANLGAALVLEELLTREGANVVLTRRDNRPVDLWPRVQLADSLDADLLVSIHNNALPDGVNPYRNHGSSAFYFHPASIPLARAIQQEMLARFGLPDLGIARGDLALVRGTWMPSVLTEGLFMMVPDQEAALGSPAGRRLYAEAVFDGIRRFLSGGGL